MIFFLFFVVSVFSSGVKHVHLIDTFGNNMLFRGGSPEVDKSFSFSTLVASLELAAKQLNATLPSRYFTIVINVENLDTTGFTSEDGTNVVSEHAFFANNSALGQFYFWHMVGTSSHPAASLFDGQRDWLAATYADWGTDKLVSRVETLRTMLTSQNSPIPLVIFFHCDCGCDRTGQLAGAYAMRFHNASWDQVVATNRQVAGRPQLCPTHHQMQWYCVYANSVLNISSTGNCLKTHVCTPVP
jgi:hypothetical protein